MLPSYVLLDLETTGATPLKDRITEIALIKFEDGKEVDRWQTLVNPQTKIPDFIQSLTGITNEMVENAPTFEQVAGELLDYLDGAVMCAHNVRFDHGFLKAEFKRIGITLKQKVLCTVKLSRKLYPQYKSHGLSAIIERHNFTCSNRHRAMGDVEVMAQLIELAKNELGTESLEAAVAELSKKTSLPPGIDEDVIDEIPETSGVYLFYGENNLPLYIGKSVNLRARVMSHFSSDHSSTKEMRISQEIKHIEWIETAGEFGALLLESRLVKERQPIYNRQLRRERQLCAWQLADSADSKPLLTLIREDEITPENMGSLFGTFRSKKQATEVLRNIAEEHALCLKALGLESGKGACFRSQIKRCKGVCCGNESPELHYLRLKEGLISLRLKSWQFQGKIGIKEHDPETSKTELHVFDQWCHIATVDNESLLAEAVQSKCAFSFDLDTYKLLLKELSKRNTAVIPL
ncbi:MAG: DNA polymerase III subunit epsilon [Methylophilaceae bacterium]|jgi:DNA polymerase III subunit epsilon|nr:DNA polymerase III subunit epsilon [Methylophilaceae bacterium]